MQMPLTSSIKRTPEGQEYHLVTGMPWVGRVLLTLPVIAIMLAPPIPQPWAFLTTMLFTGLVVYGQNKNQLNNQPDHEMVKHWAMWSYFALLIISLVTFLAVEGFVDLLLATLALVALSFFITSRIPWRVPVSTVG